MDGVIWALLVPLTALGTVAGLRRQPLGVDPNSINCSNCRTPMSPRRVMFSVWPGRSGDTAPSVAIQPSLHIPVQPFVRFAEITHLVKRHPPSPSPGTGESEA
jgi:hypothetical protein